jgi:hypothetical protein
VSRGRENVGEKKQAALLNIFNGIGYNIGTCFALLLIQSVFSI